MTLEFADLRAAGLRELERLNGGQWTDFNVHDPGITILEAVAYALTDLGYRAGFPVPDLLAEGGGDPYDSLYPPEDILTTDPVTTNDLRAIVLDVPGVLNAWVEPWVEDEVPLHYDAGSQELGMEADPPATEPVTLSGLSRVLVELAGTAVDAAQVEAEVARRVFRHRPVGQDFEIVVLKRQPVKVRATIEIEAVAHPDLLLADVLAALDVAISPPLPFSTRADAVAAGLRVDEVLEGPLLDSGYVAPGALARTTRRPEVHTSDLVHAVMAVPGVRAVASMTLATGDVWEPWSVRVGDKQTAAFDAKNSKIELTRGGLMAESSHEHEGLPSRAVTRPAGGPRFPMPAGRDRAIGSYSSFQLDFPAAYGVGELGLPASAPVARRAQALQLKAYLLFFDQVVANLFAQLAHTKDLLAFQPQSRATYFGQEVADPGLGFDEVRTPPTNGASATAAGDSPRRRDRFLNHLLARFAEEFADHSLVALDRADEKHDPIADKQAFLRSYVRVSSGRGTAADDLAPPGPENRSGLEERIRLKLGLIADAEQLLMVEHILLRPVKEDELQEMPFLEEAARRDPFSHQVSFVFRAGGRFASGAASRYQRFRQFAERTVREETPAHLITYVHWLPPTDWDRFEIIHADWRAERRAALRRRYGLAEEGA